MQRMRSYILLVLMLSSLAGIGQEQRTLSGRVTDGQQPVADVTVRVAGTPSGTYTDARGYYEIAVRPRDTVIFSSVGYKTYRYLVEDVSRFHNPVMLPNIVELDEVVVEKTRRKTEEELRLEYPYNQNLFQTAFGMINAETMGASIRVIPGEEILPIGICILDFMRARFPGVRVVGDCYEGGNVILRGGVGSLTQRTAPVWDVDGMIFRGAPIWIPLETIERMAIVAGLGFTARYGQAAGVIIINTKNFSPKKNTKTFDMARLRNNYLEEDLPGTTDLAQDSPTYLKYLQSSPDFDTAKRRYDSLKTRYKNAPYFLLDAYSVFSGRFGAEGYADAILETHGSVFETNPVLLKALAYIYESQGRLGKAETTYERVFKLRPRYVQSYLDMARIKRNRGEARRALALMKQYKYLVEEEKLPADTVRVLPFVEREWNNLLSLNKTDLVSAASYSDLYVEPDEEAQGMTRIVVEWNHSDADFELQFVNPGDRYYTWKHSVFEDAEAIMDEKILGFNSKEFILDKSLPGRWRINVKYLGNKSLTPTYLKITRYENYGTPRQQSYVSVHKLQVKNLNYELLTLDNPALVAAK